MSNPNPGVRRYQGTVSLSRLAEPTPVPGRGYLDLGPRGRDEREHAHRFLMGRMLLPGGTSVDLSRRVDTQILEMTLSERVMMELEIDSKAERIHTFDYDPLA